MSNIFCNDSFLETLDDIELVESREYQDFTLLGLYFSKIGIKYLRRFNANMNKAFYQFSDVVWL